MIEGKDVYVHPQALVESDRIGDRTRIWAFAHVMQGAVIGKNCNIGDHSFVEKDVVIGDDSVIKNGVSLWEGTTLESRVFVGPNAAFTNDRIPRAKAFKEEYDKILVKEGASIGANATIIAPRTIGQFALVGGGAVITQDVPDFTVVYGNPARVMGYICRCGEKLPFQSTLDGEAPCRCGISYQKRGNTVKIFVST